MNSQSSASPDNTPQNNTAAHEELANAIRFLSIDGVQKANSGHPGMPMGMADVATVLFKNHIKIDPTHPTWPDRDRFVLSAGHGSMLLYSLSYLLGYEEMTIEQLKNFRQVGSLTAGHPEVMPKVGIETTTGPLGQGISNAVGMALAERHLNARYGDDLVDHHTYVIASDGDLMEGISHEACSLAGHLKLGRLIVLYDDNEISIDGKTDLSFSDDTVARFKAYGWDVQQIDGHDPEAIDKAITKAKNGKKPSLIACRTTIGYGSPNMAGTSSTHGSPLGEDEVAATREALKWNYQPFDLPDHILETWRSVGRKSSQVYADWQAHLSKSDKAAQLQADFNGRLPENLDEVIREIKYSFLQDKPEIATRKASGQVLESLIPTIETLVGGSADLTPSNNTRTKDMVDLNSDNYGGHYIRYGVREHAMAAAMNGMALHGGVIPYAGTFLVFSDYARPSIRLAALMKQRVIHVMTHDSIGLGEDGPTHQPVEHLAALRAIPRLQVLRPADSIETAECWQIALESKDRPTILVLTRQSLPTLRETAVDENLCYKGAYVLREADADHADVTLIASGSEVSLAVETSRDLLERHALNSRIVTVPSRGHFFDQPYAYRQQVLGPYPRFIIEAGRRMGWDRFLNDNGRFFGVDDFGESGPYKDVYAHFKLTPRDIADSIVRRLESE